MRFNVAQMDGRAFDTLRSLLTQSTVT
jgi:hypothetical protein